jgi:hypothetical protein
MYTREQAAAIRQNFWTRFGKYMAPVLSADGEKINWINYKTGIPNLFFRMNAGKDEAYIGIEIMHKNLVQAEQLYRQWEVIRPMLEEATGEAWRWEPLHTNETGGKLGRIYTILAPANVFKESDWPSIISFLKPRIIALDDFWVNHKMIFEMMS